MPQGQNLVGILSGAGFQGDALRTAYAIAMRESGGRADAFNGNRGTGDQSYGLFQINMLGDMGPARRRSFGIAQNEQLLDPATNARAAFAMSKGGKDFGAWGIGPNAYRSGAGFDTIKKYYDTFPGIKGQALSAAKPSTGGVSASAQAAFMNGPAGVAFGPSPAQFKAFAAQSLLNMSQQAFAGDGFGMLNSALQMAQQRRAFTQASRGYAESMMGAAVDGGTIEPVDDFAPGESPGSASSNPQIQRALQIAGQQIGKPYVWGAETPQEGGFDCSGLIDYSFKRAGIKLPGRLTTYTAMKLGQSVKGQPMQPGDWIISNGGKHMTMYVGNGQVISAPRTGTVVQYQPVSRFAGDIVDVRRYA